MVSTDPEMFDQEDTKQLVAELRAEYRAEGVDTHLGCSGNSLLE